MGNDKCLWMADLQTTVNEFSENDRYNLYGLFMALE